MPVTAVKIIFTLFILLLVVNYGTSRPTLDERFQQIQKDGGQRIGDNKYIVEYDIKLTKEQYDEIYGGKRVKRKAAIAAFLWSTSTIPYDIDTAFTSSELTEVNNAIQHWNDNTCLTFRPKLGSDSKWIYIERGTTNSGCFSGVGQPSGTTQTINLEPSGCVVADVIIHEIGHAIGFFHEQSRPDRDSYVNIIWANIQTGREDQFEKYDSYIDNRGVTYDYTSIMHYGKFFFSKNYGVDITIETIDPAYQDVIGTATVLSSKDIEMANLIYACAPAGSWGVWGTWGSCSLTCGGGTQTRTRSCEPSGSTCSTGSSSETQSCNTQACPDTGSWGNWGAWSSCTVTCGGGTISRSRSCEPSGATCSGTVSESMACNTQDCSGSWGVWGTWGSCTVTCGGGTQTRTRSCEPSGSTCSTGSSSETQSCNTDACSGGGTWANWGPWDTCSVTCGGGTQTRTRTCTPTGSTCPGLPVESQACNTQICQAVTCPEGSQIGPFSVECLTEWFLESGCFLQGTASPDNDPNRYSSLTVDQVKELYAGFRAKAYRKHSDGNSQKCLGENVPKHCKLSRSPPQRRFCLSLWWQYAGCSFEGSAAPNRNQEFYSKWMALDGNSVKTNMNTIRKKAFEEKTRKADGVPFMQMCFGETILMSSCDQAASQGPHSVICQTRWWRDAGCSYKGRHSPNVYSANTDSTMSSAQIKAAFAAYYQNAVSGTGQKLCLGPTF